MSAIAGLVDFRQEAPPADVGVYQLPCSVLVFQFTFSGTTYVVAVRSGVRGWVLIDFDTDATVVIQSAINFLGSLSPTGGKIFLVRGTYWINAKITVSYRNVMIEGEGHGAASDRGLSNIKLAAGATVDVMVEVTEANCHLRNLHIHGNTPSATINSYALYVGGADCSVENIGVQNSSSAGLSWIGSYGYAKNVYLEYNDQWGGRISGDGNVFVNLISAGNNATFAGLLILTTNSTFIGLVSVNDNGKGFYIQSNRCSFIGCQVINSGHEGYYITKASRNIFVGCQAYNVGNAANNTYDAFYLGVESGTNCTRNVFADCQILSTATNKHRYGVNESDTNQDYNVVIGGVMTDAATDQIRLQGAHSFSVFVQGYNPQAASTPTVPASPATFGPYHYPVFITVTGGTVSDISIRGQSTGLTSGSFYLYPTDSLTITYTAAPTVTLYPC